LLSYKPFFLVSNGQKHLLCVTHGMLLAFTKGSWSLWIDPRCARARHVLAIAQSKEDYSMTLNYIYLSDSLDVTCSYTVVKCVF